MVLNKISDMLDIRRQKKASKIVEENMLDSYKETEEIKKAESIKKEADRLVHLKQYKTAIDEYKKALELYPYKVTDTLFQKSTEFLFIIHHNLATTYSLIKEFKESIDFFNKALSIENIDDEMKVKALSGKGNCYLRAKKFIDQVKEKHAKTISLESNFEREEKIRNEVKRMDEKENLLKKAHECFKQATDIDTTNPDAWYQKGSAEFQLGMIKEAISSFDTVINIQDNYENKEEIELFDEIKREKGLEILEKQDRVYKTKTGHYVKNKEEMAIANFLFENNLLFQYNLALTWTDLDLHANFYIPQLELYIEHFKKSHDGQELKLNEYKNKNKRLVYTTSQDENNLEETLKLKIKQYISL